MHNDKILLQKSFKFSRANCNRIMLTGKKTRGCIPFIWDTAFLRKQKVEVIRATEV